MKANKVGAATLLAALVLLVLALAVACGDDGPTELPPPTPVATTITISPASATLRALGETIQLTTTVRDQSGQVMAGAVVTWASGDGSVASVSGTGLVSALGNGRATITATAGTATGSAEITVVQEVSTVTVSPAADTLVAPGDTVRLSADAADANGNAVAGATFVWQSDYEAVAAVDSAGLVRAIAAGTATITATAGAATRSAEITVVAQVDRGALVALYEATGGPDWANSDNWLTEAPLRVWYGVEVDGEGRAIRLTLSDNELTGAIPPEIGSLSNLTVLRLDDNGLTGELPARLGRLAMLTELRINGNSLSGALPLSLTALPLREFHYAETGLCIPPYESFREWLNAIPSHEGTGVECTPLSDRDILEAFYNATDGPNWKNSSNWLTDAPLVRWHGVSIDGEGRVVGLNLFDNQLSGRIPPEIGSLSNLKRLDLRVNLLTGVIPSEFSNLSNLEILWLGDNALSGAIPPELGDLSKVESLSLNNNRLSGTIPPELGNLFNLEYMNLDRNRLAGAIPPELGDLSGLKDLDISYNILTGAIPPSFLQLDQLSRFVFSANEGLCAPGAARFLAWLQGIDHHEGSFCNESDATVLKLLYEATGGDDWTNSDGWFGGADLSRWHGMRADSIGRVRGLDLGHNGLIGALPSRLAELAYMTELRINGNGLSGPLPASLTALPLREFHYADTELCAPPHASFREWLSAIPSLNGTGMECAALSDRDILVALYEATDGPSWTINTNWLNDGPLENWHGVEVDGDGRVITLKLARNNLTGQVPADLGNLLNLTQLDLRSNKLAGPIPAELGNLSNLRTLWLLDNALTGEIPANLGNLSNLTELRLNFNKLTGAIRAELGNLSNLTYLSLASNPGLTGSLPRELGNLSNLRTLDLYNTRVTGEIPAELGNLSSLTDLILYRNRLTGEIPPELGNLSSLRDLFLFDNNFTGTIPRELDKLSNLEYLRLDYNGLTGTIPGELGNLSKLRFLDLGTNQLTGGIPGELGKLRGLTLLYLDDNYLTGAIPSELGNLSNLRRLILSRNVLTGAIPPELGSLTALQQVNLTHNAGMHGILPVSLVALNQLEVLLLGGTGLCAPREQGFFDWLGRIPKRRVALCGEEKGSFAYLTQAVQSIGYPVPLVAGDAAMLRVFVRAQRATTEGIPPVRASFYLGGAETYVVDIPAQSTVIPTEVDEGVFSKSANAEIPGAVLQPGLEMVVEIDPNGTLDPGLGVSARIPATGRAAVDVQAVPPFDLTVIPFLWNASSDSSVLDLTRGLTAEDSLLWDTGALLPVGGFDVTVHEPSSTPQANVHTVLALTEAIRILEGASGHYLGIIAKAAGGGAGVALLGGRVSASVASPSTIAHEFGHNFNLLHAPCGGAAGPDRSFPQTNGSIGAWGYDFRDDGLVSPDAPDLMSYCHPRWVSDYNFTNALDFRMRDNGNGAAIAAAPAKSIFLWGGVDERNVPYLEPAFVVDAPPVLPRSGGEYALTGRTAGGDQLFSLSFDMPAVADGDGRSSFAFALPAAPEWADALAGITLSGPGGSFTLDGDSDRPAAILRDPLTGRVRGILRDPPQAALARALAEGDMAALSPEPGLQVLFSRGIPDSAAWRR